MLGMESSGSSYKGGGPCQFINAISYNTHRQNKWYLFASVQFLCRKLCNVSFASRNSLVLATL